MKSNFIFCIGTFWVTIRYLGITFSCNAVIPCKIIANGHSLFNIFLFSVSLRQTHTLTHSHSPTAVYDNMWLTLRLTFQPLQDEESFSSCFLTERSVSHLRRVCSGIEFRMHCVFFYVHANLRWHFRIVVSLAKRMLTAVFRCSVVAKSFTTLLRCN